MALFQCKFLSKALYNNTDVTVFIPSMLYEQIQLKEPYPYHPDQKFQVLYLLHGHSGDNQDWISHTNVLNYVEERQVAVVMPNALDSFYCDMAHGKPFWTYISEELPLFINSMFPISTKREDTFVAGLSMGGYGALKLALNQPNRFFSVGALSGLLDVSMLSSDVINFIQPTFQNVFGDKDPVNSDDDLLYLIEKQVKNNIDLPDIYLACGSDDFLLQTNKNFMQKANQLKVDFTYEEEPGAGHEWAFWDKYILRFLDRLPLKHGPITGLQN